LPKSRQQNSFFLLGLVDALVHSFLAQQLVDEDRLVLADAIRAVGRPVFGGGFGWLPFEQVLVIDLPCPATPRICAASPASCERSARIPWNRHRIPSFRSRFFAVSNCNELPMVDHRSTTFPAAVIPAQKKTPRVARPKGFLRANPFGSAHRHAGEKLQEHYHRSENVNPDFHI
jgi:hypothetical protein